MRKVLIPVLALCLAGCPTPVPPADPVVPAAEDPGIPTGLTAVGSYGQIELSWSAVTKDGLTGYNVYRGTNGTDFSLLSAVNGPSYTDTIPVPAGNGILYYYRVTSVCAKESEPSSVVMQMHGTRLPPLRNEGSLCTLLAADSPYVLDGESVFHDILSVGYGASLYLLPGSKLTMISVASAATTPWIMVYGTLQSIGLPAKPVTITCTKADGSAPASQKGLALSLGGDPWDPATSTGSVMRYTRVTNLSANSSCQDSATLLENCYFTATPGDWGVIIFKGPEAATVRHCLFTDIGMDIRTDMRGTAFSFTENRLSLPGPLKYILLFGYAFGLDAGQVSQNDLYGPGEIYLFSCTDTATIPLGGNYWNGGTPTITKDTGVPAATTVDLTVALTDPPAGAGPDW